MTSCAGCPLPLSMVLDTRGHFSSAGQYRDRVYVRRSKRSTDRHQIQPEHRRNSPPINATGTTFYNESGRLSMAPQLSDFLVNTGQLMVLESSIFPSPWGVPSGTATPKPLKIWLVTPRWATLAKLQPIYPCTFIQTTHADQLRHTMKDTMNRRMFLRGAGGAVMAILFAFIADVAFANDSYHQKRKVLLCGRTNHGNVSNDYMYLMTASSPHNLCGAKCTLWKLTHDPQRRRQGRIFPMYGKCAGDDTITCP